MAKGKPTAVQQVRVDGKMVDMVGFSTRLPVGLMRRARLKAVEREMTLQRFVQTAVERAVR